MRIGLLLSTVLALGLWGLVVNWVMIRVWPKHRRRLPKSIGGPVLETAWPDYQI